ncbi:MAG TPA: Hpt domain-containing protein [Burkholderiaceae bacterium]
MTAQPDSSSPNSRPCIDTRIGLASTNGNEALYQRLLQMFENGQHDVALRFRVAQAQGDAVGAMRLVHNLRTSASTLGMMAVGDVAFSLETACREGVSDPAVYATLLADLERALAPVLVALRSARENPRPATRSDPPRSD